MESDHLLWSWIRDLERGQYSPNFLSSTPHFEFFSAKVVNTNDLGEHQRGCSTKKGLDVTVASWASSLPTKSQLARFIYLSEVSNSVRVWSNILPWLWPASIFMNIRWGHMDYTLVPYRPVEIWVLKAIHVGMMAGFLIGHCFETDC